MAQLGVNWREVSELSKRTLKNSEDFEDARAKFQETIKSLTACWKGTDAVTFITNSNNFLDYLHNDSEYLNQMGTFFKIGSSKYNGVVDEHEDDMKKYNERFEEDYHLEDRSDFVA